MYKTTARNAKRSLRGDHDIYGDLAKIKDALVGATTGMKDRAGEVISQSFDDVREKSAELQENFGTVVAHKPLRSVLTALGAGMLIGYFIHK